MRPTRVLHIIDGLGGGGSERLVWDIVRLSHGGRFLHRVVTAYPDDGNFVYADRLYQMGAYSQDEPMPNASRNGNGNSFEGQASRRVRGPLTPLWQRIRSVYKRLEQEFFPPKELSWREVALASALAGTGNWSAGLSASQKRVSDEDASWASTREVIRDPRYFAPIQRVTKECLNFRPDVIHGHAFYGLTLGLFVKLIFHRPLVFQLSALFSQFEDVGADFIPDQCRKFRAWVDRFVTAYPSELTRIGVPAEKIFPIEGAIDLQDVARIKSRREAYRAEIRQAFGIGERATVALSVGRLHESKGHEYALEALARLVQRFPDLHWIVIGAGSEKERTALETRAAELGVSDHAHVAGFVSDPLPFYASADIYLRTAIFEGDNLSSYQAMAFGLPVVAFDTKRETELITRAGHGVLAPVRDAQSIATAVADIISLPDQGRAMGQRGAEYCRAHLDIQLLVNKLENIYCEVLEVSN